MCPNKISAVKPPNDKWCQAKKSGLWEIMGNLAAAENDLKAKSNI